MSEPHMRYRVWLMRPVVETNEEYRKSVTEVIGLPKDVECYYLSEAEFLDLQIGLESESHHTRPTFFYQKLDEVTETLLQKYINKGQEKREAHEQRVARLKADEEKRRLQAEKRKVERERKKFEKLKAKFGDKE